MGFIEATICALELLQCNGSVDLGIEGGRFELRADLRVVNERCKQIVEKALAEASERARALSEVYPNAKFTLDYKIVTTFSNIVAQ